MTVAQKADLVATHVPTHPVRDVHNLDTAQATGGALGGRYGMARRAPSASKIVPTVPLTARALRRRRKVELSRAAA
jgi:hypothetical protein